jgi:hypothetical protein
MVAACNTGGLPGPAGDMAGGGGAAGGGGGGGGGTGDMGGRSCAATCNRCVNGVCCGNACCGVGEWCDTSTLTCRCGDHAACTNGNTCQRGGPIGPGEGFCGTLCCGSAGSPCPL